MTTAHTSTQGTVEEPPYPLDLSSHRRLLDLWSDQVSRASLEHATAANAYSRLNRALGVPAIVVSTIVGTSIFASMADSRLNVGLWPRVVVGCVSVAAVILTALQTFFNYGASAALHQKYWAEYECIQRRIAVLATEVPVGESVEPGVGTRAARYLHGRLREIEQDLERVDRTAPSIPFRYLEAARRQRERGHARSGE